MSSFSGLTATFSNTTLIEGLGLVQSASHGMLEDPELAAMQQELKAPRLSCVSRPRACSVLQTT